jgi:Apea-like HEPN
VVVNPFSLPAPSISDGSLSLIEAANKMILSLEELKQNKALLSLRWFEQSQFELSGIDKFLKSWIAVETIGMPDTSNIRPLIESLAQAYGETSEEIKKKYKIGRLLDLRSRIVHDGLIFPIHSSLSTYVEALYVDALYIFLGLKSERRLERITNIPGFDVMAYLPK